MNNLINWNDWNIEEESKEELTNEKFIKFLEDNNDYDKFIYNFKYQKRYNIETFCDIIKQSEYIMDAFIWDETKQGDSYWLKLNYKWKELLIKSI
jgi:hypothetical protein